MNARIAFFLCLVSVPAWAAPKPCDGQPTQTHAHGGGQVAVTATVSPYAFIDPDSMVCGHAQVKGAARVLGGSEVSGDAVVENSILYGAKISDAAQVLDSEVRFSTVMDRAAITGNSDVLKSTIGGELRLNNCMVTGSTLISSVTLTLGARDFLGQGL